MSEGARGLSKLSAVLAIVQRSQPMRFDIPRHLHAAAAARDSSRALPKSLRSPKASSSIPPTATRAPPVRQAPPVSTPAATPAPAPSTASSSTPHRVSANTPSWPWRPVASTLPGVVEEERVIYARPFEGPFGSRVRMLWFLVPFYGIVVGFYLTTPKLPRKKPPSADGDAADAANAAAGPPSPEAEKETPQSVLWSYTTPLAMIAITLTGGVALLSPSRFVTRLSLIRQRSTSSPTGETKGNVFIRMQHGGHLMMTGELAKARQLPLDQVQVRQIAKRSPYLSLKVTAPRRTRFSLDAWPYRLDFRDTLLLKNTDEEVVLSLQRIEQVFGRL